MCLSIWWVLVVSRGHGYTTMIVDGACLGDASAEVASNKILIALQFRLDDDEGKVGLGFHVSRHLFDLLDLLFYPVGDALEQAVRRPSRGNRVRGLLMPCGQPFSL